MIFKLRTRRSVAFLLAEFDLRAGTKGSGGKQQETIGSQANFLDYLFKLYLRKRIFAEPRM